ncbi:MAG: MFS transporter [Gaiellaceae bacterium]
MDSISASLRAFATVLKNRRVRNLQIAGAGSTLGTWAYAVALPVFAYHAGGARAVGLLFFARYVLAALAAPWLGVVADRWSRQRLMLTADVIRAGIFAGMTAVASVHGSPWAVYVLAVTSTIVSGSFPPAQAALLPTLVTTPEELTAANLVGNTIASLGMFAGPAIAGILLAVSGPTAVFALNGGLFLWSAAFVLQVERDERPERTERTHFLAELATGFTTVLQRRALRVVVGLTAAETLVVGTLEVLLVVLALRLLHSGNAGVGWLNTALGIGSFVGAAAVAVLAARRRLAGGFAIGLILTGAPFAALAALGTLPPALLLLGAVGAGSIIVEVSGTTLLQRSADNEVLGRVFAVLQSLIMGSLALGSIIAPGLVSWLGPRGALIAAGAFLPALLVPLWPSLLRIDAAGEVATEPLALLRGVEIFAPLPEQLLERLAASATTVDAAPGREVATRGETGHYFYVIASGGAAVELEDGATRELGPGDYFGEIALLRDVPRTATVRAVGETRLYAIAREEFLAAVTGHGPALAAAEAVMAGRLSTGALAG